MLQRVSDTVWGSCVPSFRCILSGKTQVRRRFMFLWYSGCRLLGPTPFFYTLKFFWTNFFFFFGYPNQTKSVFLPKFQTKSLILTHFTAILTLTGTFLSFLSLTGKQSVKIKGLDQLLYRYDRLFCIFYFTLKWLCNHFFLKIINVLSIGIN